MLLIHYKPGVLGTPLTELEKQLIIEKKFGATILNDYKQHTKLLNSAINSNVTVFNQNNNLSTSEIKEKQ